MPVDLAGWGSLLGGAGVLGSSLGLFGGGSGKNAPSANRVYAETKNREDTAIQRRVADARRAGIHPLFALGAGTSGSPAFSVGGGDGGRDLAAAGLGLQHSLAAADRLLEAKVDTEKATRRNIDAQTDLMESAAPAGSVAGVPTPVVEPVEPSRDIFEQIAKSHGAISIEDPGDKLFSWAAAKVRDSQRRAWHRREMRKLRQAQKWYKRRKAARESGRAVPPGISGRAYWRRK